jgi:hypothetical protein
MSFEARPLARLGPSAPRAAADLFVVVNRADSGKAVKMQRALGLGLAARMQHVP